MAEFEVAMREATYAMAATLMAFDLAIGNNQSTKDRDLPNVRANPTPEVVGLATGDFMDVARTLA